MVCQQSKSQHAHAHARAHTRTHTHTHTHSHRHLSLHLIMNLDTSHQQWTEHLVIAIKGERHEMLGHVCRMDNDQQPDRLLFHELVKAGPFIVQSSAGEML